MARAGDVRILPAIRLARFTCSNSRKPLRVLLAALFEALGQEGETVTPLKKSGAFCLTCVALPLVGRSVGLAISRRGELTGGTGDFDWVFVTLRFCILILGLGRRIKERTR